VDTDFYQGSSPYRGARLPSGSLEALLPAPRQARLLVAGALSLGGLRREGSPRQPIEVAASVSEGGAAARRLHSVELRDGPPGEAAIELLLAPPGSEEERRLEAAGAELGAHDEAYALIASARSGLPRVLAGARRPAGLLRAAATLVQLLGRTRAGGLEAPAVAIADEPALDVRLLGGWALCRAERLREAIDLAASVKANRVLYNWWGWIPGEEPSQEDAYLAAYARERGVELVCELRRMSFGKDYPIAEPAARRRLLDLFERAARAGFRSFGLLFDDVAWETAEEECALAAEVHALLAEVLGGPPELFCCPRFYWYPGQMSLTWKGAAGGEETAEQRAYLEAYGRLLPAGVHLYLANFWGGTPPDYQGRLEEEYTRLVGRRPVFFDNQLINDYRLGALFPFALKERPSDFAAHVAGYTLNAPRPLDACAAAAAAALAYAWNPEGYDPERALGAAIRWQHGERAPVVAHGINLLCDLANEWSDGISTATNHYATIWRQVREGRAGRRELARWREAVREVREGWLDALREAAPSAWPAATRGLLQLLASSHRLESDLELFAAYLEARECGKGGEEARAEARRRFQASARGVRRRALEAVADILPPLANLQPLIEAADGTSAAGELAAAESQGWSWVEYFYARTRRELEGITEEMLGTLECSLLEDCR
jgi:hypothetical protein